MLQYNTIQYVVSSAPLYST